MLGNTCTQQIANNLPFITISQLQGGSEIFIAKHNIFDNHDNLTLHKCKFAFSE